MWARVGFNWVIRKLKEPGPILEVFEKGPWECLGIARGLVKRDGLIFCVLYDYASWKRISEL